MKLSKIKTLDFDAKIKTQGWVKITVNKKK